jgi:hypothetical protein
MVSFGKNKTNHFLGNFSKNKGICDRKQFSQNSENSSQRKSLVEDVKHLLQRRLRVLVCQC